MKTAIILFSLLGLAMSAKLEGLLQGRQLQQEQHARVDNRPHAEIVRYEAHGPIEATYNYILELDDGTHLEQSGAPGSVGQANIDGTFSYVAPDGTVITTRYRGDEGGFYAEGDHLPQPHPDPPHVAELLRIAEEQRAAGIVFE